MLMKWYDTVAPLYDLFTYKIYKKARKDLIERLALQQGDRVLVVACGTGQSFSLIESKIGNSGEIVGIDFSGPMLSVAQKRIAKNSWYNVKLIQEDVRVVERNFFINNNIAPDFDAVIAELAFSVLPEWTKVMQQTVETLKINGKIGILDWYRPEKDLLTRLINFIADADSMREIDKHIAKLVDNFETHQRYLGGNVWVGTGIKK